MSTTAQETMSARPRRRKRWIVLYGLIAIIAAYGGWMLYRYLTRSPQPIIDYHAKMMELVESYQPAGSENGWPLVVELHSIHDRMSPELRAAGMEAAYEYGALYDFSIGRTFPVDREALENEIKALRWLREQGALDVLDQVASSPRFIRPLTNDGQGLIAATLPEARIMRELAQARMMSMYMALEDGNGDEAVRAFEHTLALARVNLSQGFLIEHLVGVAITHMALQDVRSAMQEHDVDEATLRGWLGAIDRQLGPIPPFELAIRAEEYVLRDAIQWSFSDDGHGDGSLDLQKFQMMTAFNGAPSTGGGGPLNLLGSMYAEGRATTVERLDGLMKSLIAESKLNAVERAASPWSAATWSANLPNRQLFLKFVAPPLDKSFESRDALEVLVEGTRIMLAIEAYRAAKGALPRTLDALVPEYLAVVPLDPATGQPFAYKIVDDAGETRLDYLLYSIGTDLTDNGGSLGALDAGTLAHPTPGLHTPGFDMLINAPRVETSE